MQRLIDAIDAELPQTQCGKCGQPGCRPYAEAIANGEAINRCPPGGERTVARLAALTGRPVMALEQPAQSPLTAYIREDECIGCTKCIQACPVDAILGAAKQMHTVIVDQCTGCELCVAPCPVDCIDLLPHPQWQAASSESQQQRYLDYRADQGRKRFDARQRRLAAQAEAKRERRAARLTRAAPASAAPALSASALRANRVRLAAALKRLTRQQQNSDDDAQREALTARIAEHQAQLDDLDRQLGQAQAPSTPRTPGLQQKRMAVNAAEQSLRKARQQLAHAERQHDAAAQASAHAQIDRASAMLEQARAALASQSPSHGQPS
ncbi:RnfABCDGE type electron transport complex subunit B [Franzmannia qiaohouensis]|uniref:RnfABCDGE type electron transport complex subunit B n=1 Tax=Franzmannia qiaohouensis TaxID=1329370 RepID=A0ABU1HFD0_9GAMM|nr:RnfABCDGE type electron transport complex subunit B [Halomonas qiaohouensis]MDR5906166.1 RnfABCDGE type electron transport complex subunit B [Halomonas qiaohouensis]